MADNDFSHIAQVMEAAMSHVDIQTKTTMDLMSKFLALMGCLQNYKKTSKLAACGFENQKTDLEGLLSSIRPLCSGKELAFIDQILSMFQAKRMFETYNAYMAAMKAMQGFDGSGFGDFASGTDGDNTSGNSSGFDFSSFFDAFGNNKGSDSDSETDNETSTDKASDSNAGSDSQNNSLDMLKAMIPPEKLSTFENLSMLFKTMSYDNSKSD